MKWQLETGRSLFFFNHRPDNCVPCETPAGDLWGASLRLLRLPIPSPVKKKYKKRDKIREQTWKRKRETVARTVAPGLVVPVALVHSASYGRHANFFGSH